MAAHQARRPHESNLPITSYAPNTINPQAANLKQGTGQTPKGKSASLVVHTS